MIFYKGAKTIQWRRDNLFNKQCHMQEKKMNRDAYVLPCVHINVHM